MGEHTDPALDFILAVYDRGTEHFYLRAPITYNPDGSITFSESVPEGATVQLTEAIRELILNDTRTSTATLAKDFNFQPVFAMAFSCAFRKDVLGTRVEEELQILKNNLPGNIPVSGFYSYGEIAPLVKGQESFFHGATLVTLLVGQSNGQKTAAGHDPAILYDPSRDTFKKLEGSGIALGVDENFAYHENYKSDLKHGNAIAIGTDGIWEASNQEGKMFGKERFRRIIRENAKSGANDILNAVYYELNQFSKGVKTDDDVTLVVIKLEQ